MWPLIARVSAALSTLVLGLEVFRLFGTQEIHGARIYDTQEASKALNITREEVIRLIKSKKIQARKLNGQYRIPGKSLLDYLSGVF